MQQRQVSGRLKLPGSCRMLVALQLSVCLMSLLHPITASMGANKVRRLEPHDPPSQEWKGRQCTFVRVHVPSKNTAGMGWALNTLSGAEVVNGTFKPPVYQQRLGGKMVCHMVVLPASEQLYKFALYDTAGKKWSDAKLGLADPACAAFQNTQSNPLTFTKDIGGQKVEKLLPRTCSGYDALGGCSAYAANFKTWACEEVAPHHFARTAPLPAAVFQNSNKRPGMSPAAAPAPATETAPIVIPDGFAGGDEMRCPDRPKYRRPGSRGASDPGCGPDMVPVIESLSAEGEFFAARECWQSRTPVRFDPFDPFNARYQSYCQAQEAGLMDGCYTVLRFTTGVGNRGNCDLYLGNPVFEFENGSTTYEWADCHKHWHWKNFATYEIIDTRTRTVSRAAKTGFCALDSKDLPDRYSVARGGELQREANRGKIRYFACGEFNMTGCQGVSVGKQDVYEYSLSGQFFCISGCRAGQVPLVWNRNYTIRIHTNPPYVPTNKRDPCFKDRQGRCHRFYELDYTNNMLEWTFNLTRGLLRPSGDVKGGPYVAPRPLPLPSAPSAQPYLAAVNQRLFVDMQFPIPDNIGVRLVNGRPVDPLTTLPQAATPAGRRLHEEEEASARGEEQQTAQEEEEETAQGEEEETAQGEEEETAQEEEEASAQEEEEASAQEEEEASAQEEEEASAQEKENAEEAAEEDGVSKPSTRAHEEAGSAHGSASARAPQVKKGRRGAGRGRVGAGEELECRGTCGSRECIMESYFAYDHGDYCRCEACRMLPVGGDGPDLERVCWGKECEVLVN